MGNNKGNQLDCSRQLINRCQQARYVSARILWPALGFPEVIAPKSDISVLNGTNCIELLILSNNKELSSEDVAYHLRHVPWKERHCRYLPQNTKKWSFASSDIEVKKVMPIKNDQYSEMIRFASGWVVATLAKFIREFYDKIELQHLYQIRISEHASSKLDEGLYNLFWINRNPKTKPEDISTEMNVLLRHFAMNRKPDSVGCAATQPPEDYEYVLGYKRTAHFRTEVLHPLFVHDAKKEIRIAHVTDPHVAVRNEIFGQRLADEITQKTARYNNYNTRFKELYYKAKSNCDLLIITGDIVDYGRGFVGKGRDPLGNDNSYSLDRNWSFFYSMIAAGESDYEKPLYTVLGNHDWRLNPYGPLNSFNPVNAGMNLTSDQMVKAHGEYAKATGYGSATDSLVTDLDSVKWYLLLINPFFDYTAQLPGKFTFLILDWAKDEEVIGDKRFTTGLPVAQQALTDIQKKLVSWVGDRKDAVKVLALHPGVVAPWPNMPKDQLMHGLIQPCPHCSGYGRIGGSPCRCVGSGVPQSPNETTVLPLMAFNDPSMPYLKSGDESTPTYGTLKCNRDWLIKLLRSNGFALALSGHAHRNSIFVVLEGERGTNFWRDKPMRVKPHLFPHGTALCVNPDWIPFLEKPHFKPIFINTAAAGPIGGDLMAKKWDNKKNKWKNDWATVLPGYNEIVLSGESEVKSVKYNTTDINLTKKNWECWIWRNSKANYVKMHQFGKEWNDRGILGGYDDKKDAIKEKGADSPWFMAGKKAEGYADYECWVKKPTKAKDAKLYSGGIIGVYSTKKTAKEEAEPGTGEPWPKWSE